MGKEPWGKVLVIAGSDSCGGAGVQADIKTINALGGIAITAITALTAQNTMGVQSVFEIPAPFVAQQMDAVLSDMGTDAVKTGMLVNKDIIREVSLKLNEYGIKKIVVDPVLVSKNNTELLKADAIQALTSQLFPLSRIVTPNIPEAERISGCTIKTLSDAEKAARIIHQLGPTYVLIKGGHAEESSDLKQDDKVFDILYDGQAFEYLAGEYIPGKNIHGTGCTYASAIATVLAKGKPVNEAAAKAKDFITVCIQKSFIPGNGYGILDPFNAV